MKKINQNRQQNINATNSIPKHETIKRIHCSTIVDVTTSLSAASKNPSERTQLACLHRSAKNLL